MKKPACAKYDLSKNKSCLSSVVAFWFLKCCHKTIPCTQGWQQRAHLPQEQNFEVKFVSTNLKEVD